jgi:hypothetical protein
MISSNERSIRHTKIGCVLSRSSAYLFLAALLTGFPFGQLDAQTTNAVADSRDAQLAEATALNEQVVELYNRGKYSEALPLAQKALRIREKYLGTNHADTALSLFNVAAQYRAMS